MKHHLAALTTSIIWGSTFVASKGIIESGIQPLHLMTFRFLLAYCVLWLLCHEHRPIKFDRPELLFFLLAISGGSVYFYLEYTALQHTSAVNVGLLSSTVPLIATAMSLIFKPRRLKWYYYLGSFIALIGATLVIFNGNFNLHIVPFGDLIALLSVILWSIYTVILELIGPNINPLLVSRRLFFYAFLTLLPFVLITTDIHDFTKFANLTIIAPATYLGLFASALCIWMWNHSVNKIGLQTTNNYLYLLPMITVIVSAIFARTELTIFNLIGSIFILTGIMIADKK